MSGIPSHNLLQGRGVNSHQIKKKLVTLPLDGITFSIKKNRENTKPPTPLPYNSGEFPKVGQGAPYIFVSILESLKNCIHTFLKKCIRNKLKNYVFPILSVYSNVLIGMTT